MVLLAGFQALLARYSGQEDLAVGSPVAGRNRVEIEGLIGFFVNTLVLRGDLDRRAVVPRAARRGCARPRWPPTLHQEVPFERLVQELAPERSLAAHASVPGDVRAAERPGRRPGDPGSAAGGRWSGVGRRAKFDLTLSLAGARRRAWPEPSSTPPICSTPRRSTA